MLPPRAATAVAPVCLVAVLLAGCGGSADDPEQLSDTSATPAQQTGTGQESAADPAAAPVLASYDAWLAGLAAHDAAATCAQHAPEFTIALRNEAILVDRAELGDPCTGFVAILWEDPATETDPTGVEVTQLTGEDALLAVDFPENDQTVRMIYHDAKWLVAATEDRTTGSSDPTSSAAGAGGPDRWLDVWCDLDLAMTRDQVIAEMGEPSGEYTVADGGEPQVWWAQDQYDFRAYLDVDQTTVLELVGDYDALAAADREQLTCPELRNVANG